jgi:hypothetical protein
MNTNLESEKSELKITEAENEMREKEDVEMEVRIK